MKILTESDVEEATLERFEGLGYQFVHGPEIAPGEPAAERETYDYALGLPPCRKPASPRPCRC